MNRLQQNRRKSGFIIFHLIVGFLIVLAPTSGFAESLNSLAEGADAIVISIPVQVTSYWEGKIIKTRALLKIEQVVSGRITDKEIPVIYEGGVVGSIGLKISHGVHLPSGQKNILFLSDKGNHYAVLDQINGVFFIHDSPLGEVVVPAGESLLSPGVSIKALKREPTAGEGIPLRTFISRIRTIRRNKP